MSTTAQCSLSLSSLPKRLLWGLPESPPSLTLTISPRNVTFHLLPQTPNTNWSGQSFHVISHRKSFPQYTQLFFFSSPLCPNVWTLLQWFSLTAWTPFNPQSFPPSLPPFLFRPLSSCLLFSLVVCGIVVVLRLCVTDLIGGAFSPQAVRVSGVSSGEKGGKTVTSWSVGVCTESMLGKKQSVHEWAALDYLCITPVIFLSWHTVLSCIFTWCCVMLGYTLLHIRKSLAWLSPTVVLSAQCVMSQQSQKPFCVKVHSVTC